MVGEALQAQNIIPAPLITLQVKSATQYQVTGSNARWKWTTDYNRRSIRRLSPLLSQRNDCVML
ncbi:hypothetical protein D3024_17790 [Escherichia coli]|nr:hypothetical protein [Escherichia coli]